MGKKNFNKLRFSFIFLFLSISPFCFSQKGKDFPVLTAQTLTDKTITIPSDTRGKLTLIGLAYSQKAEKELQTWLNPIYNEFIEKPEKPSLFDFSYDINLYFIPMFVGGNKAFAEQAKKKMSSQLDKELAPYVLIFKGELNSFTDVLNLKQEDIPYFFILDEKGKIIHTTSGGFSEKKLEKFIEVLDW